MFFFSTQNYQAYQEIGPRENIGNGKRPISDPFIGVGIDFKITMSKVFQKIGNMMKNFTRKPEFMKNKPEILELKILE